MESTYLCTESHRCQEVKTCPPGGSCHPDLQSCRTQCFRPATDEKECTLRLQPLNGTCQTATGQTLPVTNANCCESNISLQCGSHFTGKVTVEGGKCLYSAVTRTS